MPQFDIASFYPQITFFAGIFLMFYVFLTKNTLPKISQNLKLNKRLVELYATIVARTTKDMNLLCYLYKAPNILSHLIYKETTSLMFMKNFLKILTISYIKSTNWLSQTNKTASKIRLFRMNKIYFEVLNNSISSRS